MITSVHNPRIQAVHRLQAQAKARLAEGAFVVEGVRLVEEALQAQWNTRQVFYTQPLDGRIQAAVNAYSQQGVSAEEVSEAVMKAMSDTETPQGILAVLNLQPLSLSPRLNFLLILDGVRDPGNLGTILRTAIAAGVQAVLLPPGNVDAWSPKVVRAGMGAHFRLPIQPMRWEEIKQTIKNPDLKLKVYLADSKAGIDYVLADFQHPLALIVGGEASGAGSESISLADEKVHIPMPGGSESLNAAVAASILLFEVVRQREGKPAD